ncbi:hypothetical protein KAR26_03860 [Candidatus Parcubacteria bacterium]|nr:hypothetical protein [Candidatus Parcubacteria bacterium]
MARYCYVEESVLRQHIRDTFQLKDLITGSNYELVCALLIKILFEEIQNTECMIGFKTRELDNDIKYKLADTKSCKDFFEKGADKDTPVDFCISPILSYNKTRNKIFAWTFQVKRFGKFQNKKNTNGLIDYIAKIKNKYPKMTSALVIFFDGHKIINLKKVCKDKKLKDFPFETIFFIDINNDKQNYWYVNMGQLWPVYGYNAYDAVKAIKEGVLENVSFKYKKDS